MNSFRVPYEVKASKFLSFSALAASLPFNRASQRQKIAQPSAFKSLPLAALRALGGDPATPGTPATLGLGWEGAGGATTLGTALSWLWYGGRPVPDPGCGGMAQHLLKGPHFLCRLGAERQGAGREVRGAHGVPVGMGVPSGALQGERCPSGEHRGGSRVSASPSSSSHPHALGACLPGQEHAAHQGSPCSSAGLSPR